MGSWNGKVGLVPEGVGCVNVILFKNSLKSHFLIW